MAQCIKCQKKGLFLKTAKNGLCLDCEKIMIVTAENHFRGINQAVREIQQAENVAGVIKWYERLKRYASDLLVYENLGITTINPIPSSYLEKIENERDDSIIDVLVFEFEGYKITVKEMKTLTGRINRLNKFYEYIDESKSLMKDPSKAEKIIQKVKRFEAHINKQ